MKETKISKNSVKTVLIAVGVVAIVFAIAIISWNLSAFFNRPVEKEETYSIREEIIPVAKLATYEYNFTQILFYTSVNNENIFRIEIPFSENKYIATIDGTATIEVDAEKITWSPHYNAQNMLVAIDITLPHSVVKQPVTLNHQSLEELENRDGFLNEFTDTQFNQLLIETNEKQVKKAQESGLLEKSDQRVQEMIATQLKNIYGQELEVNFGFIEDAQ